MRPTTPTPGARCSISCAGADPARYRIERNELPFHSDCSGDCGSDPVFATAREARGHEARGHEADCWAARAIRDDRKHHLAAVSALDDGGDFRGPIPADGLEHEEGGQQWPSTAI